MTEPHEPAVPNPEPEPPSSPRRRPWWRRFVLSTMATVVAIVAGFLVSFLTVDLGPTLRKQAEEQGSKFIQRPMHIGKLEAKLIPGVFVVRDLVIEGLSPSDRPFLQAKTFTVDLPWWTIFTRKLSVESTELTDWERVVAPSPSSPGNPNGSPHF